MGGNQSVDGGLPRWMPADNYVLPQAPRPIPVAYRPNLIRPISIPQPPQRPVASTIQPPHIQKIAPVDITHLAQPRQPGVSVDISRSGPSQAPVDVSHLERPHQPDVFIDVRSSGPSQAPVDITHLAQPRQPGVSVDISRSGPLPPPVDITHLAQPRPPGAGPVTMAQIYGPQKFLGGYFVGGPEDVSACPTSIMFLLLIIIIISIAIVISSYADKGEDGISREKLLSKI